MCHRLAASGANASHNPSSNLRLRAGHAPLPTMLELVPGQIGLGLDGNAMADDDDCAFSVQCYAEPLGNATCG